MSDSVKQLFDAYVASVNNNGDRTDLDRLLARTEIVGKGVLRTWTANFTTSTQLLDPLEYVTRWKTQVDDQWSKSKFSSAGIDGDWNAQQILEFIRSKFSEDASTFLRKTDNVDYDFWLATLYYWGNIKDLTSDKRRASDPSKETWIADPSASLLAVLAPLFSNADPLTQSSTAGSASALLNPVHDEDMVQLLQQLDSMVGPYATAAKEAIGDFEWDPASSDFHVAQMPLIAVQRQNPDDHSLSYDIERYISSIPQL